MVMRKNLLIAGVFLFLLNFFWLSAEPMTEASGEAALAVCEMNNPPLLMKVVDFLKSVWR
jgi:hypothetical protein